MTAIPFNFIPSDVRVPGIYVEINAGTAPFTQTNRLLLIGQKLTAGTATAGTVERYDPATYLKRYGNGSMLADMCYWARKQAPLLEIWCLPLADPSSSAAQAAATVTLSTSKFPADRAGSVDLHICGERLRTYFSATDDAPTIAAAIVAGITKGYMRGNFRINFPVTAAVGDTGSEHIITLTSRHKGITQNDLDVSVNLSDDDDKIGWEAVTIVNFASGTGTLDLATALAGLGDEPFDTIVAPYVDTQALADVHDWLEARWNYDKQIYGHYFTWKSGTYGTLGSFGADLNSPFYTVFGGKNLATPPSSALAAVGADIGVNLGGGNRNRPLVGVVQQGILARYRGDAFTIAERDSLLRDGISPILVNTDRTIKLERVITTYQTSPEGVEDITWLDVQSRYLVVFAVHWIVTVLRQRYSRVTNDEDGDATVEAMRADILHAYRALKQRGIVDNEQGFRSRLRVWKDPDDPNRVNIYAPLDLQNMLLITAINATAFLRFNF